MRKQEFDSYRTMNYAKFFFAQMKTFVPRQSGRQEDGCKIWASKTAIAGRALREKGGCIGVI